MSRKACFAGSWYSSSKDVLSKDLSTFLNSAEKNTNNSSNVVKALICPHAGYAYSGSTAGWSWVNVDPYCFDTVFLLGPSHHVPLRTCALPHSVSHYETPLGPIRLNQQILQQLQTTGAYQSWTLPDDHKEHSIELQLPFLQHIMGSVDFSIVPILVGNLSNQLVSKIASTLRPHFHNQRTLFVISSDFCHWGQRFHYTYTLPNTNPTNPLYKAIEQLDMEGIRCIQNQDPKAFQDYLNKTKNTICGQNPIRILLDLITTNRPDQGGSYYTTTLRRYQQSHQAMEHTESSVSYAAMLVSTLPSPHTNRHQTN